MSCGRSGVVFDTSTLVAVLLYPDRVPAQAFRLAALEYEICTSSDALIELVEVLKRDKFDRWRSLADRVAFIERYQAIAAHIRDVAPVADCRDSKDDKFLGLALAARAACIVSSDADLLVLDPYHGIPVLRPLEFLQRFGRN